MSAAGHSIRPFALEIGASRALSRALIRLAQPTVERTLGLRHLSDLYQRVTSGGNTRTFAGRALEALRISVQVSSARGPRVPPNGPLIIVANHPFGGLDGLILLDVVNAVRRDVKLLANHLLGRIPELASSLILVDPYGGRESAGRNASALRAAARWVQAGGALGVFPAGEVSHLDLGAQAVTDPHWNPIVGRLVQLTRASVLTIHFTGKNSTLFQTMGLLHPRVRTALLPRELLKKQGQRVTVHIGSVTPYARLERLKNPSELTAYLRRRTYLLGECDWRSSGQSVRRASRRPTVMHPLAEPRSSNDVASEIHALPPDRLLSGAGDMATYCARGYELDAVLQEIGRLRELSFRGVGEGTGHGRDIDRFDRHYLQLFVWHRHRREIVGGYRMGLVDEILAGPGPSGLYTTTLFRFKTRLLEELAVAIELGRSFVRPEYQRDYSPLALLWKAIGRFVVENPRYRLLFGPVSISNQYQSVSKSLMMAFLQANRYRPSLGRLVKPRCSPHLAFRRPWDPANTARVAHDLDEVDELVSAIEADGRTVPTLLRQYLKLNARLLAFSRDPHFSDVVDSLMLVDLTEVDRAILTRYMGREEARGYLQHQGSSFQVLRSTC